MDLLKDYLTVTQVAEMRHVSRQAVLESIARGTLPATRMGQQWLVRRKDVDNFKPHAGGVPKKKRRSATR
jgi:excisionase family DNA binding protein